MKEGKGTINVKVNQAKDGANDAADAAEVEQKLVNLQVRERQIQENIFTYNASI